MPFPWPFTTTTIATYLQLPPNYVATPVHVRVRVRDGAQHPRKALSLQSTLLQSPAGTRTEAWRDWDTSRSLDLDLLLQLDHHEIYLNSGNRPITRCWVSQHKLALSTRSTTTRSLQRQATEKCKYTESYSLSCYQSSVLINPYALEDRDDPRRPAGGERGSIFRDCVWELSSSFLGSYSYV